MAEQLQRDIQIVHARGGPAAAGPGLDELIVQHGLECMDRHDQGGPDAETWGARALAISDSGGQAIRLSNEDLKDGAYMMQYASLIRKCIQAGPERVRAE